MIIDANEHEEEILQSDICIVGAGIAGITIAREFLNSNLKVIVLESGGKIQNDKIQTLSDGENIGIPYYDLDTTRNRAFGGTSHFWRVDLPDGTEGVRLRGLDTVDFEKREWIPNSGWPFPKEELDPYYERAHEIFKIGPYSYNPKDWIVNNKADSLHFERDNIQTTIFQFAKKDVFYNDYFKQLESVENISVLLNSTVLKIKTQNSQEVNCLSVISQNKKRFTVKAENFIIAAGGLENARLLLLSDDEAKEGLGNKNDLVGRYFMEHPHQWRDVGTYYPANPEKFNISDLYSTHIRNDTPVMGYLTLKNEVKKFEQLMNCTIGINGKSKMFLSSKGLGEAKEGLKNLLKIVQRNRSFNNLVHDFRLFFSNFNVVAYEAARRVLRGRREKWNRYGFRYSGVNVKYMAEQQPNPESRVKLSSNKDYFGQRKLQLDWRITINDLNSIKKTLEILDKELRQENLGHLEINFTDTEISEFLEGGYHHMGTTRMHEDDNLGVVDPQCKMHGIDNLFLAGSSVFPTSGYANPTLTIVALALRLSDHLKKEMKL